MTAGSRCTGSGGTSRIRGTRVASDTSELQGNHGAWSIGNPGLSSGKYYARAGKKPGCKADASKTIQI